MKSIVWTALAIALNVAPAAADTISIIGVVVKGADRVAGATVKLYSTANKNGVPLAQDTASDRGVFNLYRTNIAGDLGDLYVIYEGVGNTAAPLKVSVRAAQAGLIEVRTPDLQVQAAEAAQLLTKDEAATAIASITLTESVLARVGAKTDEAAKTATADKAQKVLAKVPQAQLNTNDLTAKALSVISQHAITNLTIDTHALASQSILRGMAVVRPGGGGVQ